MHSFTAPIDVTKAERAQIFTCSREMERITKESKGSGPAAALRFVQKNPSSSAEPNGKK